jgi:hypothetical protein
MAFRDPGLEQAPLLPRTMTAWLVGVACKGVGCGLLLLCAAVALSLLTWSVADPSLTHATTGSTRNLLGPLGAVVSDLLMQLLGLAGVFVLLPPAFWALHLLAVHRVDQFRFKLLSALIAVLFVAGALSALPTPSAWPIHHGLGGLVGDVVLALFARLLSWINPGRALAAAGLLSFAAGLMILVTSLGLSAHELSSVWRSSRWSRLGWPRATGSCFGAQPGPYVRREPVFDVETSFARAPNPTSPTGSRRPALARRLVREPREFSAEVGWPRQREELPSLELGADPESRAIAERFAPPPRAAPLIPTEEGGESRGMLSALGFGGGGDRAQARFESEHEPDLARRSAWRRRLPSRGLEPTFPATPQLAGVPADDDEFYDRAVELVVRDRKASTSYLQRRLGVSYIRAADLIERMERDGIVGPVHANGQRSVLISVAGDM